MILPAPLRYLAVVPGTVDGAKFRWGVGKIIFPTFADLRIFPGRPGRPPCDRDGGSGARTD